MSVSGTLLATAKAAYHATVPLALRDRLWLARRDGGRVTLRRVMRTCRTAVGGRVAMVSLPHGRIAVDLRDTGVGQQIYDRREYEPNETAVIRRCVRPGDRFVDVGANVGYFTLLAATLVGPAGRVVAVEPEEHNFRLLSRTVALNRLANVTAVNVALGEADGEVVIRKSATNFGDHRVGGGDGRVGQPVRLAPLDAVLRANGVAAIDFLKMDVQGYECHVVRGMQGVLAGDRRLAVLCEFWPHGMRAAGGDPDEFLRAFAGGGFGAHLLGANGVEVAVPIAELPDRLPPFDPAEPDGCFVNVLFKRG